MAVETEAEALASALPLAHLILLLGKAGQLGLSSTAILRQCGVSFSLEDLKQGRVNTVAPDVFARLREACTMAIRQASAAPGAKSMDRASFELMCHALISSLNLGEVIDRLARFLDLCDRRFGWFEVTQEADEVRIELHMGAVEEPWADYFRISGFLSFARLFEWFIGEQIPFRFVLSEDGLPEVREIARVLGVPAEIRGPRSFMGFAVEFAEKPVARSPSELRQLLLTYPFDAMSQASANLGLSARLAAYLKAAIGSGSMPPGQREAAQNFGMAAATLRRRLDGEGRSFRQIRDAVRAECARDMLSHDNIHIDKVAERLGFTSVKSFSRAFHSWCGVAPADFRKRSVRSL